MKIRSKMFFLAGVVLLALSLLAACGSSGGNTSTSSSYDSSETVRASNVQGASAAGGEIWATPEDPAGDAGTWDVASGSNLSATNRPGVKMVYTAYISMESTEFDSAVSALEQLVADMEGYFENSDLNNERSYRRSSYVVRIPAEHFDAFCTQVGALTLCQINSISRSAEDISEVYYDTEARLNTQKTKLERLQALLAQAENMEDIITLETAISETTLEIDNLTGSLRKYDALVGYSTIEISLREVYKLTETEEPAIGFSAKLAAAFRSGSASFVDGMQDLLLGVARGWAGWLLFLVIVALVVTLIVRARRKKRAAWAGMEPPESPRAKRHRERKERKENKETSSSSTTPPTEDKS